MEQIEELSRFIKEHASDDLNRLLLSASRYPGIDIPFVVDQLKSRRQIKDKLPSWYQNDRLVFPAKIAAEQCSSEQTALYKQRLVDPQAHVCDLTGGLIAIFSPGKYDRLPISNAFLLIARQLFIISRS